MAISTDPIDWYQNQVVFLTGATGSLGGCLLYKLTVKLPTAKIYVLCRGSKRQAMDKWETSMPEQVEDIFDTGKVHCLIGDITQPDLGLEKKEIETLQREVTVVIHTAAKLSLFQELPASLQINCLPVISLARMVMSFVRIKVFLHVSSISTQSFLPGPSLLEKSENISCDEESPEIQLEKILATGQSPYADRFMAPYAQAKYLSEKLLLNLQAPFPVLIVRPASIGPAIQDPYPLYGPEGAIPTHTFARLLIEGGTYRKFEDTNSTPKDIILDEVPVDIVSNACLLHLAIGSTEIVHVGSQLYTPVTVEGFIGQLHRYVPKEITEKVTRMRLAKNINFIDQADEMFSRVSRVWNIDCERSKPLRAMGGPIGLSLDGHDFENFAQKRIQHQARRLESWVDSLMSV
ncbi:male sterility protein-domain-containing protein [Penicillium verhagenii]|nr:male sterility protein-domain-containing protein [Penicillium verhagenii]